VKKIPFVFDPTMATTIEVDVEEDCTTTVKSIPITSPAMGFCVDSRTILEASFPKDCNKLRLRYEESMFVLKIPNLPRHNRNAELSKSNDITKM